MVKLKALLKDLNITNVIGSLDSQIDGVASLSKTASNKLMFCISGKEHLLTGISDCVVIVSRDIYINGLFIGNTYLLVENPRLAFIHAVNMLYARYWTPPQNPPVIDKSAQIHKTVSIGYNCSIGRNVKIYPHVTILCDTRIDDNVIIHPNAAIGVTGFGQERNEHRELEKFPHLAGVHICKNVEIGAGIAIDRGTLSDTVIGEGTMMDNLTHVAHSVRIGKHCEIMPGVIIGGSVKIGDYSMVSFNVAIRDNLTIGNNVVIGMGAVVLKDVKDGEVIIGNPGRVMKTNAT